MDGGYLMIIGLTGGIGSGKSTAAELFQELGVNVIRSDAISHDLLIPKNPVFKTVIEHFGSEFLQENGSLDRKKLGKLIFSAPEERRWLEQLLHPLIKKEVKKQALSHALDPYLMVEIPLLIEAHFEDTVDRILVVDCPEAIQIDRAMKRDNTSREQVLAILKNQADRETRLARAHDVIKNTGSKAELKKNVQTLHQHYCDLKK